jgi:iron complex transport system ATP-binding protein
MAGNAVLSWRGVQIQYAHASRYALNGVDLDLVQGEVLAIIGPNGAGKTTLLQSASGWLGLHAGRVTMNGQDLRECSRWHVARQLAVVAQTEVPPPDLTVRELVELGRTPHQRRDGGLGGWIRRMAGFLNDPKDAAAVDQAVSVACLEGHEHRLLGTLSGGEVQRAILARALAQQPRVLLMDEPNSSLDPAHQLALARLVRRLVAEGQIDAAAVVLHDLNLATLVADRMVLLSAGQVEAMGSPATVLTSETLTRVFRAPLEVLSAPGGRPLVAFAQDQGPERT